MTKRDIVIGPPGTGKTTTLLKEVEKELSNGTAPDRIAYLAFTRKAAKEAIERLVQKYGKSRKDFPHFRTIHSFCFKQTGMSTSQIMSPADFEEFGELMGVDMSSSGISAEGLVPGFKRGDRMLFMENSARIRRISLRQQFSEFSDGFDWREVARFEAGLKKFKEIRGVMDFTDCLEHFCQLEYTPKIDVIIIDEAQDLSDLQWDVIDKISANARRVVVAGDDDQTIYRWAGADVEQFVHMEGNVKVLDQSYRIPRAVQAVADKIINRVSDRREKHWKPRADEGQVSYHASIDHIDISKGNFLVLARNKYLLNAFEQKCSDEGYLYTMNGDLSVSRDTLAAIHAWERLRKGEYLTVEEVQKVYRMTTMVDPTFRDFQKMVDEDAEFGLQQLQLGYGLKTKAIWHEALNCINPDERDYLLAALRNGLTPEEERNPRIELGTIHGSKGGESDNVILLTDMSRRSYNHMQEFEDDEARVFYVGVTRCKNHLHLIEPSSPQHFYI